MNIALIVPGFSRDANDWAIPALQNLVVTLAHDHNVHVFSLRYPAHGRYQFNNLTVEATGGGVQFGLASLGICWRTVRAILRRHRQRPFDILHAFWADEPGFTAVVAGVLIQRPVIVSLGGGELSYFSDIDYGTQGSVGRRFITRFALTRAALVTAGSEYQACLAQQHGVTSARLRLAPLGVDVQRFHPGVMPDPARPLLVQAASLSPVKNQALLLESLRIVAKTVPQVRLHVAGDGPLRSNLVQLTRALNLEQQVTWHGAIPYTEMPSFYQGASLYVQTSRHESQGMALLEALACGVPVVGTPVGVLPELSCRPAGHNTAILASQIVDVLRQDQAAFHLLRQQAQRTVAENYSLAVTTNRFLKHYSALVR